MFEKIKELAKEYTTEEIKLETNLRSELGLTSFDLVSLISEIEETYDIKINDEDIESILTVKDLIDYIENKKQ